MVEGSNADAGTNRRIRAYINNTDLGYLDDRTGMSTRFFQHNFNKSNFVFIGQKPYSTGPYALDEVTIWVSL